MVKPGYCSFNSSFCGMKISDQEFCYSLQIARLDAFDLMWVVSLCGRCPVLWSGILLLLANCKTGCVWPDVSGIPMWEMSCLVTRNFATPCKLQDWMRLTWCEWYPYVGDVLLWALYWRCVSPSILFGRWLHSAVVLFYYGMFVSCGRWCPYEESISTGKCPMWTVFFTIGVPDWDMTLYKRLSLWTAAPSVAGEAEGSSLNVIYCLPIASK